LFYHIRALLPTQLLIPLVKRGSLYRAVGTDRGKGER
jgi:hypothetical protein